MPEKSTAVASDGLARSTLVLLAAAVVLAAAPAGRVHVVRQGGDLQAAIDRARGGDTIALEAGAVFEGQFVLPPHDGDGYVTIRTSAGPAGLPPPGVRVDPSVADRLPKLRSSGTGPVISTRPGAHHWRLQLLELQGNRGGESDIVRLGDGPRGQARPADVPHDLIIDRCYIHGDEQVGQKNGIALHSAATEVRDSHISGIASRSQESHGIIGWNGPGPFTIVNNLIEASGINVMFGGADPGIPELVPSDIAIRGNHIRKRPEWRDADAPAAGGRGRRWLVKNLLELKSGRRVTIDGNLLEYNWFGAGDQPGYAVLFRSENPGRSPWTITESVEFTNNVVRHVPGGVSILGTDSGRPAQRAQNITVANNLWVDVNPAAWSVRGRPSNARFALIAGATDVTFDANTVLNEGSLLYAAGEPSRGFRFTRNIAYHGKYGVKGDSTAIGTSTLERYFPDAVFTGNIIAGGSSRRYPEGNAFPSADELTRAFVNAAAGDFRLGPRAVFATAAGPDSGVRADRLCRTCAAGRP